MILISEGKLIKYSIYKHPPQPNRLSLADADKDG